MGDVAQAFLTVQLCTLQTDKQQLQIREPTLQEVEASVFLKDLHLLDPSSEVLNEEFAQVVQRLQLFGLRERKKQNH